MRVGKMGRDATRIPSSWAGPLGGVKLRGNGRVVRPSLTHTLVILLISIPLL